MRMVHEIDQPMQVSGSGDPYLPAPGKSPTGFRIEICAENDPNYYGNALDTEEHVFVEGDAAYVHKFLTDCINVVENCAAFFLSEGRIAPNWMEIHRRRRRDQDDGGEA